MGAICHPCEHHHEVHRNYLSIQMDHITLLTKASTPGLLTMALTIMDHPGITITTDLQDPLTDSEMISAHSADFSLVKHISVIWI